MFHYNNETHHYYLKADVLAKQKSVGKQFDHNFTTVSGPVLKKVATFLQPHANEFCRIAEVKFQWCTDMYSEVAATLLT